MMGNDSFPVGLDFLLLQVSCLTSKRRLTLDEVHLSTRRKEYPFQPSMIMVH